MSTTHTYIHTPGVLSPLIEEEISRVAASAYDDEGNPLYDGIATRSLDADELTRLETDALLTLEKRLAKRLSVTRAAAGVTTLTFDVPDFDNDSFSYLVTAEITRFITLNVCAAWFQDHAADKVEEFAGRSQVALDKVVELLHTRKPLTRRF